MTGTAAATMTGTMTGRTGGADKRALVALVLVLVTVLVASACLPAAPSRGRGTPVKRVLVMGDSLVHGLFGTTPKVTGPLTAALSDRGVQVRFAGYPGETPIDTWPTNSTGWIQRMQAQIASFDPDMVIVQSVLFPDPDNSACQQLYAAAMTTLLDIAQSRGSARVSGESPPCPWCFRTAVSQRRPGPSGTSSGWARDLDHSARLVARQLQRRLRLRRLASFRQWTELPHPRGRLRGRSAQGNQRLRIPGCGRRAACPARRAEPRTRSCG